MTTIPVTLRNRVAQIYTSLDAIRALKPYYSYQVPGCRFSDKYKMGVWDGYYCMMRRGRVASGLFLDRQQAVEDAEGIRFQVNDQRQRPAFGGYPDAVKRHIRDYQHECVDALVDASNLGGLVLKATGTGKTFTAGAYFSRLKGRGMFVVDERTLLVQSRREIERLIGRCGIAGGGELEPERVMVATVQTLHRRIKHIRRHSWLHDIDVVFVDEIHVALNDRTTAVIAALRPKAVFGLTATLELDKPDVRMRAVAMAGPPVYTYPIQQASDEGRLTRGHVMRVHINAQLRGRSYEQQRQQLIESWRRNSCVASIVSEAVNRGRRVIVLVQWIEHLHRLSNALDHIDHWVLWGDVPQEERAMAIREMDAGQVSLLLASSVFAKGVDILSVDVIVDASGTKSTNAAIQRYGRGVRRAEGKRGLLFVDIADVGNRFEAAAQNRCQALESLGVPVKTVPWGGSAGEVLDAASDN